MFIVYWVFIALHVLGLVGLLGGYLAVVLKPRITDVMVWGARISFISGVALFIVGPIGMDKDYDLVKMAVKLLLSLAILGLAEATRGKQKKAKAAAVADGAQPLATLGAKPAMVHLVGALTVIETVVALVWR
jgi:hypothetical protein